MPWPTAPGLVPRAVRDLDQARDSELAGRHEWACFAAHQSSEKAVNALHLHHGQEAWSHLAARLVDFGSYARGDWGVGSDLDVMVVLDATDEPFERWGLALGTSSLPVHADLVVYAAAEWRKVSRRQGFGQTVAAEAVWVYQRD